ncbi:family 16 glycosylhydrolase [Labilibaculum sp.]|uniref:glycoside hydrolase family 16 protein n=1 Tax=Labilibaculum sp. TaxID=2060723 RepID=UPI00356A8C53
MIKYKVTLLLSSLLLLFSCNFKSKENSESNKSSLSKGYQLVWSDEFNELGLPDSTKWMYDTEGNATGWGNNELQHYTHANKENAWVENGFLGITALKEQLEGKEYTSARLNSKVSWLYGKVEVKAKLPDGRGTWPAIWMLGANIDTVGWPACGEIDIMEHVGYDAHNLHGSLHTPSSYGSTINTSSLMVENCAEEFNVYGMIWTEDSISFYVNDEGNPFYTYAPAVKTDDNWPFYKPQFFILNLAVGGDWGGVEGIDEDCFPQSMQIDYVRIYQKMKAKDAN